MYTYIKNVCTQLFSTILRRLGDCVLLDGELLLVLPHDLGLSVPLLQLVLQLLLLALTLLYISSLLLSTYILHGR